MAGWSREKRLRVEKAFYEYLDRCKVQSKDAGEISLGQSLYWGQRYVVTKIFDALERDIHKIYILKSRQLGMSTLVRALTVFLLGVHKALRGAIVFDTEGNKIESRAELEMIINDLPKSLKFPQIKLNNRAGITLQNNSKVLFMSAGVRKTKSSGTLGRSVGLTIAHCSELCSWDNDEGLEAFEQSLSDVHPDRLYVYESTARGFNKWNDMWVEARKDPDHCMALFLGWWSKPTQRIDRSDRDFEKYGVQSPTDKEIAKIKQVKAQYNFDVTSEQLAWVRRRMDPSAAVNNDGKIEFEGSTTRIQEQPWCVTADTRVGTDLGLVAVVEAAQASFCSRGKIIAGGPTGIAEVWRVKTKLGYEFRGTGNHPLITIANQQIELKDSLGARIRLQPPTLARALHVVKWSEPPISCEVVVTPDLARFIGLFMGDGSAGKDVKRSISHVSICCDANDGDVVKECVRLFKTVFDIDATLQPQRGWVTVRTGQRRLVDMLRKLNLLRDDVERTARRVHVPDFIWRSPKYVVREFLSGLFEADGFNAYETNRVALFSKYPEFISDVQLLLLAFGITSRAVSMRKKAGDGHYYTGNQLELRSAEAIRFNEEIGFISSRKRNRYDPVAYAKKTECRRRPIIIYEDEVASVERTGEIETVWNLTIEGEHLFDANGILTHNTEEEAFQQTGSVFFTPEVLTDQTNRFVERKYERWLFSTGAEFTDTIVSPAPYEKMTDLKVWEQPEPNDACYVLGIDPAFGENTKNDRSSIQVFRCYADGLDQVAEYASPLITAQQLAWVTGALLGWYGCANNEVRYILEINGPGGAVFNELKSLQFKLDHATWIRSQADEKAIRNIFANVRRYISERVDAMGPTANWHWKTTQSNKVPLLERFRDHVSKAVCRIRSIDLINEMQSIAREEGKIGAQGSKKDDRVLAAALAVHCWESKCQKTLIAQRRTREADELKKSQSLIDRVALFNKNNLDTFFSHKQADRQRQHLLMARQAWRYSR